MSRELEIYATAREKGFSHFSLSREPNLLAPAGSYFVWRGTHNWRTYGESCFSAAPARDAEAYACCLQSAIDFLSGFEDP